MDMPLSNAASLNGSSDEQIPDEQITVSHRQTEQIMVVRQSDYVAGLADRYRNWRLAGNSYFVMPPVLLSSFLFTN